MQLAANREAAQAAIIGAIAENNAAGTAAMAQSFSDMGQPIAAPAPAVVTSTPSTPMSRCSITAILAAPNVSESNVYVGR